MMVGMNNQKQFFNISLACDLMRKSIDQVLEQCATFNPSVDDSGIADKLFFDVFDSHVGFSSSERKGDRYILCEAPFGPFRQNVPVPFSLECC